MKFSHLYHGSLQKMNMKMKFDHLWKKKPNIDKGQEIKKI